jgi:hypothetical protein
MPRNLLCSWPSRCLGNVRTLVRSPTDVSAPRYKSGGNTAPGHNISPLTVTSEQWSGLFASSAVNFVKHDLITSQ